MFGIAQFLSSHIGNPWIIAAILGFLPLSEVRMAIVYGLLAGLNPLWLFAVSVIANILEIQFIFWLLGKARAMDFIYRKLGKRIDAQIDRSRKRLEKYEEFALIIIVAAPIPGTGASIAALVAEMLKLDRKKAFLAISAGVIISAMLIFSGAEIFEMILGNGLK